MPLIKRLALVFFALTLTRAAHAQTAADLETARALLKEGRELRARGELQAALRKLQAAHTAGRTPVTGIELARTYAANMQLVEAREAALDVARIPVAVDETERSAEARREAATLAEELRARIAELTVRVLGVPEGATVRVSIDGTWLAPELAGEPRKLNPAKHIVVAQIARGGEARETVDIAEGESRVVSLTIPPRAAREPDIVAPAARGPNEIVVGASFVIVPQVYLPPRDGTSDRTRAQGEITAGLAFEIGAALTPSFEFLLRGMATIGQRGSPATDLIGIGPGISFRVARRFWLGASLYGGRADMKIDAGLYATDWVFQASASASLAVVEWSTGEWLLSFEPGYYFAGDKDNPVILAPILFGFRSY